MPVAFTGSLNTNKIFSAIYNMIISQQVFADNIAGANSQLVDKARVDGGLFGDTKLYYATDVLSTHAWGADNEASNLLALDRPEAPKCQKIVLDTFRQIRLTVDNYLSKQAWSNEGAFSSFNSVMLGWIRDTKKVYDACLYNTFIGTTESNIGKQTKSITLTAHAANEAATEKEAVNRLNAQEIAEAMANLIVDMKDVSRDFNDYGYLRSYSDEAIKVIWSSKYANQITKLDLPTMFHKDGLIDKFEQDSLPARFFGRDVAEGDVGSGKVIGANGEVDSTKGTVRSRVEKELTYAGDKYHLFPGDALVTGMKVDAEGATVVNPDFDEEEVYVEDASIICKVVVKLPPYMSAFEVGTNFFNPRSLTENHYLTFGYNTLDYLANYPFITIKKA